MQVKLVLEWNCSFQFASYKQFYHKVYHIILIEEKNDVFTIINRIFIFILYQCDIENWCHHNMKFYIAPR